MIIMTQLPVLKKNRHETLDKKNHYKPTKSSKLYDGNFSKKSELDVSIT